MAYLSAYPFGLDDGILLELHGLELEIGKEAAAEKVSIPEEGTEERIAYSLVKDQEGIYHIGIRRAVTYSDLYGGDGFGIPDTDIYLTQILVTPQGHAGLNVDIGGSAGYNRSALIGSYLRREIERGSDLVRAAIQAYRDSRI